jgi:FAD synthase
LGWWTSGLTNSKGETQTIEIHYFDFNADLYNQKLVFLFCIDCVQNKNSTR